MPVLNHNFFAVAVRDAQRYRDAVVAPLPVVDVIDANDETFERACNRVDVSVIDFVNVANDATPDQALRIHARLERLLIALACAADVAKDRALGPRRLPQGAA